MIITLAFRNNIINTLLKRAIAYLLTMIYLFTHSIHKIHNFMVLCLRNVRFKQIPTNS